MKALALVLLPSLVWAAGDAEPAPEGYVPPNRPGIPQPQEAKQRQEDARLPKWRIAVAPHFNILMGDPPPGAQTLGYGAGIHVTRAMVPIGRGRFGLGGDFGHDRFQRERKFGTFSTGTQLTAHTSFAALVVFDGIVGRVRPWLGLGGGLSVAQYESPPTIDSAMGESRVGVTGLVKVALGFGVRVYDEFELGLRADYNATLSGEQVNGKNVWQPGYFMLGLDLGFRVHESRAKEPTKPD
jgi:hypothetical protein